MFNIKSMLIEQLMDTPTIYKYKQKHRQYNLCHYLQRIVYSVSLCAVGSVYLLLSLNFSGWSPKTDGHSHKTFRRSSDYRLLKVWRHQVCVSINTRATHASVVVCFCPSQTSSSVFSHTSCTGIGTSSSSVHSLHLEFLFSEEQRADDQ